MRRGIWGLRDQVLAAFGTDEAIAAARAEEQAAGAPPCRREGEPVIAASYVLAALAAVGFGYRLVAGPSLTDRVIGVDGLLIVGVTAIALRAMQTGEGAFLPVALVVTLVSFVSTAVVARFIEGRGR